jgi:hypothetical protein
MKVGLTGAVYGAYPVFEQLFALLKHAHGVPTYLERECSMLPMARSKSFNAALNDGCDVLINIDPDNVTNLGEAFEVFRSLVGHTAEGLEIVSAVYAAKADTKVEQGKPVPCRFAFTPLTDEVITFGPGGGIREVKYCPFGMTAIRGDMMRRIGGTEHFPETTNLGGPLWANHRVVGGECLSDDYSFCHTARELGVSCHVDTRLLVGHLKQLDLRPPQGRVALQAL